MSGHSFRNSPSLNRFRKKYNFFDYLVVIDFEATCERDHGEDFQHEIIQFPAVLIDLNRQEIVDEFNAYCKPRIQPTLSDFCVSLTGIRQGRIDSARNFVEVLEYFKAWLKSYELGTKHTFSLVADGPCDFGKFLYIQCQLSEIEYPSFANQWIDIRLLYFHFYGEKWHNLPVSMDMVGLEFSGALHNGLDDARNIAIVLLKMIRSGANPIHNERILLDPVDQAMNRPMHKHDLKTVKYVHPRDFFASQNSDKSNGSDVTSNGKQLSLNDNIGKRNEGNWYRTGFGPPPDTFNIPSPSPIRRLSKLKETLREYSAVEKAKCEDEFPVLKTGAEIIPATAKKTLPSGLVLRI